MNKKRILMFAVALMLCAGLCACNVSKEKSLAEALTGKTDWEAVERIRAELLSERDPEALQLESKGVCDLEGLECKVYNFGGPNAFYEVVSIDQTGEHILIMHSVGSCGITFWSGIRKGATFCGLTENYVLYEEDGEIIAISYQKREECQEGEYAYDVIPFEELSEDEKDSAVYPYTCGTKKF